ACCHERAPAWKGARVMSFLAPLAAVLALTLPAILALYFLKIRRPTRIIPALHLWPNQIRDRQANVPWQRLRPSWLLFLQLLAAVTGDHDSLHRAVSGVFASNGAADLSAALALAAGLVRAGDDARAYLFSDGIVQPLRASFAAGLPFSVEYHNVGVSGENVGLTALTVRTSAQTRAAYLHVQNFGQQARSVSVEWRAD